MKQFLLIFKLYFKNAFNFKRKQEKEMKKSVLVLIIAALAFTYLMVIGGVAAVIAIAAPAIKENGFLNEFLVLLYAVGGLVVLIFGALQLLGVLFFSKDSEFFLSLPVKSSTVFLAKFAYVYVMELILATAILLPLFLTVAIAAKMGLFFYVMIFVGLAIAPSFPLMFSAILMIPLMYVVSFFKNRRAFTSIFLIVLFGAAYGLYFSVMFRNPEGEVAVDLPQLLERFKTPLIVLSNILYPYLALARLSTLAAVFGQSAAISALINAAIFIGSFAGLLGLAFLISGTIYRRGASSQLESQKKKSTGKEVDASNSQMKALIKKEWRETIRTPYFAFQCFAGIIITPLLVVMLCVNLKGTLQLDADDIQINFNALLWYIGLGVVVTMGIGMNFFASSVITREGKNFYFSKMMPVAYSTQIKAKLFLSMIISLVAAVPSLVIMSVALNEYANLVPSIIFTCAYSLGFNCLAIYVDLTKPKLDWTTTQQAMKQNFRMAIPYLVNMLVGGGVFFSVPIICTIFLKPLLAGIIIWSFSFIFAGLIAFIFWIVLFGAVDKCYERLSV